jgi:cyanophycinase
MLYPINNIYQLEEVKMPGGLLAIGGAISMDGLVLRFFLNKCGGADGRIVIIPTASSRSDAGLDLVAALRALGLRQDAVIVDVYHREQAHNPEYIRLIKDATGVYMLGGNQMRLTAVLGGTPLLQALQDAHQNNVTIAGTSAGATALSKLMIAYGRNGVIPRRGSTNIVPGLGLIDGVIFDQHFRQRHRFGRLIYAVACNPGYLGVGIDEDTGVWVADGCLEVIGHSVATVIDGAEITESNVAEVPVQGVVAVSGIRLHLLNHGCQFNLAERRATIYYEKIETEL